MSLHVEKGEAVALLGPNEAVLRASRGFFDLAVLVGVQLFDREKINSEWQSLPPLAAPFQIPSLACLEILEVDRLRDSNWRSAR